MTLTLVSMTGMPKRLLRFGVACRWYGQAGKGDQLNSGHVLERLQRVPLDRARSHKARACGRQRSIVVAGCVASSHTPAGMRGAGK